MTELNRLNPEELEKAAGGIVLSETVFWETVMANVETGYLALRRVPAYDDNNIIARIECGQTFLINPKKTNGEYVWACVNDQEGWVNRKYTVSLAGGITRC